MDYVSICRICAIIGSCPIYLLWAIRAPCTVWCPNFPWQSSLVRPVIGIRYFLTGGNHQPWGVVWCRGRGVEGPQWVCLWGLYWRVRCDWRTWHQVKLLYPDWCWLVPSDPGYILSEVATTCQRSAPNTRQHQHTSTLEEHYTRHQKTASHRTISCKNLTGEFGILESCRPREQWGERQGSGRAPVYWQSFSIYWS